MNRRLLQVPLSLVLLRRMFAGTLLVLLVAGASGCGDSMVPTAPTATSPSAVASAPPVTAGEAIAGAVYDTALRPVADARVELLDGPQAGAFAMTDGRGQFSFVAIVDDTTRFRASKEGHVTAEVTVQPNCDRCNPHRWAFFYLNVVDPPAALAGEYTLTFVADSACTTLPDALRTRSYEASVAPSGGSESWRPFKVTPKGSVFPDHLNSFLLGVAGNTVVIVLGDHTDPGVTERVTENTYFAFNGYATVSVDSTPSTIATSFDGWIDYCVNPNMGTRYDCTPGAAVQLTRCSSARHRLILVRR